MISFLICSKVLWRFCFLLKKDLFSSFVSKKLSRSLTKMALFGSDISVDPLALLCWMLVSLSDGSGSSCCPRSQALSLRFTTVWESLMFLVLAFFQASEPMVARVPVTSISWTDLRPSQDGGSTFCCAKRGGKLWELLRQLISFVFASVIAELHACSPIAKQIWLL